MKATHSLQLALIAMFMKILFTMHFVLVANQVGIFHKSSSTNITLMILINMCSYVEVEQILGSKFKATMLAI